MATRTQPEACVAVESILEGFIGAPVHNVCVRGEQLGCCFDVELPSAETGTA
jgi:hypothetical protein